MNDTQLYQTLLGITHPWEVRTVELDSDSEEVRIYIHYISKSAQCPKCGLTCSIYDHREERRWRHLDTCHLKTIIICNLPRCDCPSDGKHTIAVPWSRDHSRFTLLFERLAIDMLQSFKKQNKVAGILRISFDQLHYLMHQAVERGMSRRSEDDIIEHLGIDEKSHARHHQYSSILYDLKQKRVIDIIKDRDEHSAVKLIRNSLTEQQRLGVKSVSMDMWNAYINAAGELLPQADIVHDHFHLMKYLNQAVDQTRRREMKQLSDEHKGELKNTRYIFLSNPITMSDAYKLKLFDLQRLNLQTSRAWRLKENFKMVLKCESINDAKIVFNAWLQEVKRFKIKEVIKVSEMFIRHSTGILNYLRHRITNAVAESINSVIQEIKYSARGFRKHENFRVAVLFFLGKLDLYPHKTQ